MILLDTNVLIEILKNNQKTIQKVTAMSPPLGISSITAMELIYGARNKQEVVKLQKFINKFQLLHLEPAISVLGLKLITQFAKSHALDIPDALIAATAIQHKVRLFTYNTKDFKFISLIELV